MSRTKRTRPLVLIVDDDQMQRFLCAEVLSQAGFDTAEADDGVAALAMVPRLVPDLVLLDVMMPRMNGFDTCRALRDTVLGAATVIVMVTGQHDVESVEKSYDVGATDFITKPINWPLLVHRLRYVLRADEILKNFVRSERRLAEAQRIAGLGHFEWDSGEREVKCSPEILRIFELPQIIPAVPMRALLRCIPDKDRRRIFRSLRHMGAGGYIDLDHSIVTASGQERTLSLRAEVISAVSGLVSIHGAYQDISERERAKRQLAAARDEAHTASAAKTAFLGAISHEMRTPLNAVIGFSELIAQQAFGPIGNEKYVDFAEQVLAGGRGMLAIVDEVLTMAQLEAGRYEFSWEEIELSAAIENAVMKYAATNEARSARAVTVSAPHPVVVRGDARAIQQMLFELLSNAGKFSEAQTEIRVELSCDASGRARLTVADRGIGMSADVITAAVKPFHQVDNRLSRKYGGLGLGLSIVKKLIEHHGGEIEIVSTPMQGTRVALLLSRFEETAKLNSSSAHSRALISV
ncbi:MAG: response regulator [Alphaproteobacteria bacterium]|nr:response regulator [Alphaproteobacteria bacterium]